MQSALKQSAWLETEDFMFIKSLLQSLPQFFSFFNVFSLSVSFTLTGFAVVVPLFSAEKKQKDELTPLSPPDPAYSPVLLPAGGRKQKTGSTEEEDANQFEALGFEMEVKWRCAAISELCSQAASRLTSSGTSADGGDGCATEGTCNYELIAARFAAFHNYTNL